MPILVLDLDGTLLNHEYRISDKTKAALLKLQSEGATLVIASGRYLREITQLAKELEMDQHHGVIIGANGAIAIDVMDHEILHDHPLTPEVSRQILKIIEQFDIIPSFSDDNFSYTNDIKARDKIFSDVLKTSVKFGEEDTWLDTKEIKDLAGFVDFPLYKILSIGYPDCMDKHHHEIEKAVQDIAEGAMTTPFAFEYTALGIDKGETLKKVIALKNWKKEDIYAFGDGHNDLALLKVAGTGIAMGNAANQLKKQADFVTKSHAEDGIVHALKHFGLL